MENHLTSYSTSEKYFSELWIERFVLSIFITMYYLFDRECEEKDVRSGSE